MAFDAFALILAMLALGMLFARLQVMPANAAEVLNLVVLYVCLPAAVLVHVPKLSFDATLLGVAATPWLLAVATLALGLTLGIHSRIDETVEKISARARVGNVYVNRNQIGAVVGVQPFGGQRLSGTGPKAGGSHYLPRFTTEKTVTINTTAAGGNASLLTLGE